MLDQLTHAAIKSLGYDAEGYGNKIIAKEEDVRQGFHSEETGDSYINDAKIDDTEGLVLTAGHEMIHFIDGQTGDNEKYSKQDQETYAENIGEDFVDYTDTALGVNGHGSMANTNNHVGNTSSTVVNNTHEYNGLDKSKGDNLIFAVPVVYEVGMAVTAATAAYLQANPDVAASIYDTLSESAENAGRTLNEMLTVDPKLTDKELDVQAVVVSSLLKDLEDQSRSTEDKLEIYRLIDEYDPKAVELAKERAKAISPNTGGQQIPEPMPMPVGSWQ
ncbi:hypothetical protein [Vibrio sp. Vb339]|uniref:hypothetical protein n=1 Tax=Vibrio sp. Vb339 TaxID=1192013 RepID=UPI001556732F|nr:hypothetical protein [Vibrio sp. Vb339]